MRGFVVRTWYDPSIRAISAPPKKIAALVRDRTAPIPLSATLRDFGLPGALWLAAQQTGVFDLLQHLWPPRSGPSAAHYLLLAAIHHICQPGPKTEVGDWYDRTVLQPFWVLLRNDSPHKPSGIALKAWLPS